MSDRDTLTAYLDSLIEGEAWADTGAEAAEHITSVLGWRPPAQVISTVAELDALPDRTVVLDAYGDVFQRRAGRWRTCDTASLGSEKVARYGPLTVLFVPTEEAESRG